MNSLSISPAALVPTAPQSNPILNCWRTRVEQSKSEMLQQLEELIVTDSDQNFELFRERMRAFRWNVIYLESLGDLLMEEGA